jgi:sterol desaturase/sphingolipid hydroxylase (fatty acid hydroxylase superfamily)
VRIADFVAEMSPAALGLAVLLMLALETVSPLVPLLPGKVRFRHALRNLSIAVFIAMVALVGNAFVVGVSVWTTTHELGLLNLFDTPWALRFAVALCGLDFFEWLRHRLHHRIPFLWRLHRVHHTDPHVDSTTALRGHPAESLVAYSYFALMVVVFGIDPLALALRSLLAVLAVAWHHADFRLPARVDAFISLVTPTPRTHRMHHSRNVRFTDTNYGALFTWWDRLFGTFTPGDAAPPGKTGLEGFDSPEQQSLLGVLKSPLRNVVHDKLTVEAEPPSPPRAPAVVAGTKAPVRAVATATGDLRTSD